uniref:CASP-like protein 2U3 n=1 Tax=Pteridium aquilinum subsp. aquilinum TaxID=104588 RepID=CSPL4_PTEAA|nr:RecName: Full=CASP-like protein 2U3; Short=PaCASPL2U3 [Pteridium aquilinum subsp. aquilinum]
MACRVMEVLLRVLAILLSIAGALVMAKDKQDTFVMLGTVPVPLYARHSYVEAFVFLVYANGIVAIYCFIAVLLSLLAKSRVLAGLLFFMDQALAYLLLAAAAASTEVAYIAKRGEKKLVWGEVCSNFEHFCNLVGVSLVLTFLSVLVLVTLAILSGKRLFGHPPLCAPPSTPPVHQGV